MCRNSTAERPVAARKIARHINIAPSTRSARCALNQDCPRTWSESALERRAARLPLHAAAFWQARAYLLVSVPASWLNCSRMHLRYFHDNVVFFRVDSISFTWSLATVAVFISLTPSVGQSAM